MEKDVSRAGPQETAYIFLAVVVNECLCRIRIQAMRARARGYNDASSHVQSHNVTRNTRAHQSFSRKWNLLPSSCTVSAPCTRYFANVDQRSRPSVVFITRPWRGRRAPIPSTSKFVKPTSTAAMLIDDAR